MRGWNWSFEAGLSDIRVILKRADTSFAYWAFFEPRLGFKMEDWKNMRMYGYEEERYERIYYSVDP